MSYFNESAFFQPGFSTAKFINDVAKEAFYPAGRESVETKLCAHIDSHKDMYVQLAKISASACMRALYEEVNIKHFVPSKKEVTKKLTDCLKSDTEEIARFLKHCSDSNEIDYYTAVHMVEAYKPILVKTNIEFNYKYIKGKFYENCRNTVKNYLNATW